MEWRPGGWSVCLPLLIFPCTIKSGSSLLAPAHPGGPGKRAIKRLCVCVTSGLCSLHSEQYKPSRLRTPVADGPGVTYQCQVAGTEPDTQASLCTSVSVRRPSPRGCRLHQRWCRWNTLQQKQHNNSKCFSVTLFHDDFSDLYYQNTHLLVKSVKIEKFQHCARDSALNFGTRTTIQALGLGLASIT